MSFTEILSKLGFCSQKDKQELQENIKQNTVALNEIKRLLNNIYEQQEKKSSVLENRLSLLEENQRKLYLDIADRLDNIKEFADNNLSKAQDDLSNNIIELKNIFDDNLSPDVFEKKIKKYEKMLQRDKAMGVFDLDSETTDLFTSVIENIKDDFHTNNYDEKIYVFINMLVTNYRTEEIFRHIVEYFLVLNGFENYEKIDFNEKTYLLQYFSMFEKDKLDKLEYDSYLESKFINRIKEIQEINSNLTNNFKNEVLKILNDEIRSFEELGMKPSKEELLKIILSKIDEL